MSDRYVIRSEDLIPFDDDIEDDALRRPCREDAQDLRTGSVLWEASLLDQLNVLVAQQHVTKQSVHNVLLAQFLALPPERQTPVLRKARDWELDRRRSS